jgi:hypothetical protein
LKHVIEAYGPIIICNHKKDPLAYQINWEIHTSQAGESGVFLHGKGKLTIAKSKSSRLSCSEVVGLPSESILSKKKNVEMKQIYQILWCPLFRVQRDI